MAKQQNQATSPRFQWPWFLLAAFLLGCVLAVFWVTAEARRIKRQRQYDFVPVGAANAPATATSTQAKAVPLGAWTNDMAWIPGGTFWMGAEDGQSDEKPVHEVSVDGFWMDKTEVTNEQFEKFARATGYVTIAERKPNPKDLPGVPEENLVPGSIVFSPPSLDELNRERTPAGHEPLKDYPMENHFIWWRYVAGASWRHPEGPDSDIRGREQHPVVHIAWDDAVACCKWAGKRLPTEAEWEFAARGGLDRKRYVWGDELTPGGKWLANIWQGSFPLKNTLEDGFRGTAPVASFPPNAYGVYDMAGNVWEWCADWYLPDYYAHTPAKNPPGPDTSFDPNEPGAMKRVQRGGSFLCNEVWSSGYRPSYRMKNSPDTGMQHTGFRGVKDGPAPVSR
ncbi:MAG TPA: formylglycine-generating enzyme family protein [Verrucomicrobiae bacterium]|nr:formylglycine-generating enzyme family protein [Verrucomicrobiae bacterium]